MCGIVGILNSNGQAVSNNVIQKMTDIISHRGPDDEGQFIAGNIGLGHRRLSIIDLSLKGHQPMFNEERSVCIVYNGEIYNYKSLNEILTSKGHKIKSLCDTETIVHCYEEYGTHCVDHLRGMFSFAIWDARKEILFAAVDRLRIKPFYYTLMNGSFIFSSELKAILASGMVPNKLNMEAIHHYLSLQTIPVPLTIYDNIFTLPGGSCLIVENGKVTVSKYWDITFAENDGYSEDFYKKRLQELLYESVELRLMSDVPLGAFLSGGIDSSVIVGLMNEIQKGPIKTFSIGYDVGGQEYDDTYYARLVAKKFKTDHSEKIITAKDILIELKDFVYYLDQPSSDAINSYFVSKMAAKDVTVVLCGQGGDELFAGYSTFDLLLKFIKRDKHWEKIPLPFRKMFILLYSSIPNNLKKNSLAESIDRFLYWYNSFVRKYGTLRMELTENEKHKLYSDMIRENLSGVSSNTIYQQYYESIGHGVDTINKVTYLDLKTHLGDVLMRDVDVMSMAFSLETRIPLIDHKLVEFTATIPTDLKLYNGQKKYIFTESMKYLLPEEVLKRPKLGFAFPFAIWLRKELRPLVDYVLSREHVNERGIFNYDYVEHMKQEFYSGKELRYRKVWGLVILELWLRLVHENDHAFFERLNSQIAHKIV